MLKVISKISFRTVLYIFIGSFLFLSFINFVQFPTSVNIVDLENSIATIDSSSELVVLSEINSSWFSGLIGYFPKFIFFDYISQKENSVISSIYILTFITFLTQIILLSWSNYYKELSEFFSEKTLDSIFLYASEWAINAPPVLGVVGTIFSFGIVVSNLSDPSSLGIVFKENFANAALTTIIGGAVYVLNLFLNIFIAKNLSK
jgi:hypothetical protein